ncbi:hypothetical protein HN747_04095 [archaeon]|nr:hypothetical protein [archaeon]
MDNNTKDILNKYSRKLEGSVDEFDKTATSSNDDFSRSYDKFRAAMNPQFNRYEKWAKSLGRMFVMKVGEKDKQKLQKNIDVAHLAVTPSEAMVLSVVVMMLVFMSGVLLVIGSWLIFGDGTMATFSFGSLFLALVLSFFLFFYFMGKPEKLATEWRLKAGSQMVPAILYIVVYMKHTSNFERAIRFAAEHLDAPLSLDLRKVFWDLEVGKYSTLKDSLDNYLMAWKDYSTEFIEAFHLIESSLYEPGEKRRVEVLERALQVILDGVYDKMLKYTHEVKSPLTNIYMLGIVLPTLALAILPLASTMMGGAIRWIHVLVFFNLIIPFFVMYLTSGVISKRPGGYGDTSILEKNPYYHKFISKKPYWMGFAVAFPFLLLGFLPLIWMYSPLYTIYGDPTFASIGISALGQSGIFGVVLHNTTGVLTGPHGLLSLILSLFVPLGIALMFVVASSLRTKELITARDQYKSLEGEFTSSLFSLGNRIGDGLPAEIAFQRVAESSKGTATEGFFSLVNQNIRQFGMSLEKALFDPNRGAVVFYPSSLVATSMKILIESVRKGLKVAAESLMSLSDYVKNIKKVNDRLNDLLADITSDMKSNMTFLAPLLGGIIIGLSGMITLILSSLTSFIDSGIDVSSAAGGVDLNQITEMFYVGNLIPTYWLQIIVGIYLVQVVFILTSTLVTIRAGQDILANVNESGKNLKATITLYTIVAFLSIAGLGMVAALALKGMVG